MWRFYGQEIIFLSVKIHIFDFTVWAYQHWSPKVASLENFPTITFKHFLAELDLNAHKDSASILVFIW